MLSEETYRWDQDLERGKGYSYRQAGVLEYLILDPGHVYVEDGGRGWRLEGRAYVPWLRDRAGRWASREMPLALGLEGVRAAVYAADGHRFLREGEVECALQEQVRRRRARPPPPPPG